MTSITVRKAAPADAEGYIVLIRQVLAERPRVDSPYHADEFDPPVEAIADRMRDAAVSANSLFLLALRGERVIGALTCAGGTLLANRHTTELGIYVAKRWRGMGVGAALMSTAIEWAARSGVVERIALEVYAENARAIALYRKFGFTEEGRKRRMYIVDGRGIDMLVMARLLEREA